MKFCNKCGEAIPEESTVCPKCGELLEQAVSSEQAVVYASQSQVENQFESSTEKQKRSIPQTAIVGVIAIVAIIAIALIVTSVQRSNFKKDLVKTWYATDDSIIKVLDITDDTIEYRLETGYSWLNTSLGTYDWKVAGKNKIKVKRSGDKYETYTVKLNDEKFALTISPAFTSIDDSETWVYIDLDD